jgi:hypothetical protein
MRKTCFILLAVACVTPSKFAGAQDVPQPQMSFMSLLKLGYEIRATSIAPLVEQRQFPNTAASTHSPVLVTLQKGQSVAVCQFGWSAWSSLSKAALDDPKLCDVR